MCFLAVSEADYDGSYKDHDIGKPAFYMGLALP
jgi:hypothetical protein